MSHLALARKYRPQRFADLVGQDALRTTLERAVASNRVAHAYLFAGPRGSGKTTTARLVAKALNCANRAAGASEPCNECPSCVEITAGTSMDVLEIDGASNRGIEEIRNLRENVRYAPSGGKSKVYIIDEAHQLTDFAWNALLKTLEEPPSHVRFVFATTEPLDVPDTIASRCQVFEFRRLRSEELVAHLAVVAAAEKVPLEPEAAALIARASEGSVRDALSRLDQAIAVSPEGVTADAVARALGLIGLDVYFELGESVAARDPGGALTVLDRLHDQGMDMEEIADGLMHHLRQLLLVSVDPSLEKLIDAAPSDRERYAAQATRFTSSDLTAMLGLLLGARGQLRRAEAPRVVLEVTLVDLCTLPTARTVDELMTRLGQLEARLGGAPAASAAPAARTASAAPAAPSGSAPVPKRPTPPQAAAPPRPAPPEAPRRPATADPPGEAKAAIVETAVSDDPVLVWRQAVDRVKERKLLLGTCLEEGLFLGFSGTHVKVALAPEHAFHRAMLEMKENREILNQEFERLYGRGASLLCVSGDQAVTGGVRIASPPDPASVHDDPGGDEPGVSGLVQRIVDLFDGEILDPKPRGSGAS